MASFDNYKLMRDILVKKAEGILNLDPEKADDVVAIFDTDLNYIYANEAACKLLSKQRHELEEHNLLQIFPQLTASISHRHLLAAVSGKQVNDAPSEGHITKAGAKFLSNYYPILVKEQVYAVLAVTKKVYFP
jgi:PAS domain-containing protein